MSARTLRTWSLIAGLVSAGLALLSWSQTWFVVALAGEFEAHPVLEMGGDVAAPAIAALTLASAAGFAAMAISGPFFRAVLALLQLALGLSIVLSASLALSSPVATVGSAVTEATGLAGAKAVREALESATATAWPIVGLVAGVFLAVIGIAIVVTGRSWPASGRRYEPVRFEHARSEADGRDRADSGAVSDWDELSGGTDPTSD